MGKPRGLIYGMRALFHWSSRYPNARLVILGSLMFAVVPLVIPWITSTADLAIASSRSPAGKKAFTYAAVASLTITVAVHLAGLCMIVFGFRGWTKAHQAVRPINPPAPDRDAPPDSD